MNYSYHKDGTLPTKGEIFVFGSNLAGIHGAGAAKVAHEKFGAKWGEGTSATVMSVLDGSYAIPTKDKNIETLPLREIEKYVNSFVTFTLMYPEYGYFVTRVGCGLAGYKDSQIAPMFKGAENCSFAEEWKPYLE